VSYVSELVCVHCGSAYREGAVLTCPQCGPHDGILDVRYDLERVRRRLTREALCDRPRSHWRYAELLPLEEKFTRWDGSMGTIGWTPMIDAPRLAEAVGVRRLRLKDEGRSASGSFKDRASSVGVARAMQEGYDSIACASTGNAASSLAHCAAAVGIQANIFVSSVCPEGKLAQLLAYGARVFKIQGTYAQAYELCTQACQRFGWYNRNCAVNPYLVEGKKTGGLEVAEQCADDPPDWVAISVGDGCSIAGVGKGIALMKALGLIDWDARMLGVQAAGVAPIAALWRTASDVAVSARGGRGSAEDRREPTAAAGGGRYGADGGPTNTGAAPRSAARGGGGRATPATDTPLPPAAGETYADSINVPVPRNWRKALRVVHDSGGAFVTVSDEQIQEAVRLTGRLTGVFAEPAAAAAVAGVAEARRRGMIGASASVLAMITGSGLKDVAGALRAVGRPHEIPAELERVADVVAAPAPQAC